MIEPLALALLVGVAPTDGIDALTSEAEARLDANNSEAALVSLREALSLDPLNVDTLAATARLEAERADWSAASAHLRQLLDLDGYDDEARLLLAQVQWQLGAAAEAGSNVDQVLARHPQHASALAFKAVLDRGQAAPAYSRWRPNVRTDVRAVYDSNLALEPASVASPTGRRAFLLGVDAAAALSHAAGQWPTRALVHLSTTTALDRPEQTNALAPTTLTVAITSRHREGRIEGAGDLRFEELFTEHFTVHRQRLLAPTLWGSYLAGGHHQLRLLAGVELRQPFDMPGSGNNSTLKAAIREQMTDGTLRVLVDLAARRNFGKADAEAQFAPVDFGEIGLALSVEYQVLGQLDFVAMAEGYGRRFDQGPTESTYRGLGGVRWSLGTLELHAEYAYSRNLSSRLRSYERHQVSAGLRLWYQ